jgi:RimJ/RimL family protein N-acetyltransferase
MGTASSYIFKSERLGFRNWRISDVKAMAEICADEDVMEFFPGVLSKVQVRAFIDRMKQQLAKKGYCYFAVDTLENEQFIGFIGLSQKDFEADFTPCVDIGWRLDKKVWGQGYATEGARRCLDYGFQELGLDRVFAIAPRINRKSIEVMKKIGMKKVKQFFHPQLKDDSRLQDCVLYEIASGN